MFCKTKYNYMKPLGVFRAGTSGLVLAEPNKKSFPAEFQDQHRLIYYASNFNSIEINSSFYKIPQGLTYRKWSEMVPDSFQFTVKLFRGITHEKDLIYKTAEMETFFRAINYLDNKKGCLLIQFPAKTNFHFKKFEKLLEDISRLDPKNSWRIAVEFRNMQWYDKNIFRILDERKAALVLHDMPTSIPSSLNEKAPFVYLRFHGEKGDYRGSYTEGFLQNKSKEIRHWLNQGKDVYAYFNNTIGDAAANLKTLNEMMVFG